MPIRALVSFNLQDGVLRPCGPTFYITATAAKAYVAAVDDAARAATTVGVLRAALFPLTEAAEVATSIQYESYVAAPSNPADDVLRGNKLKVEVVAAGQDRSFTIPARQASGYVQLPDSLKIDITDATFDAFKDAYEAIVIDAFGNARVITAASIVD